MTHGRAGQIALRALGGVFFLAGLVGIVLPLVPTVAFWILAALCWTQSAPGWRRRLTEHPRYGAVISDFLERGVVPRQAKGYALATIALSGLLSSLMLADSPWMLAALWVLLASVSVWLVTRPEPTASEPLPGGRSAQALTPAKAGSPDR